MNLLGDNTQKTVLRLLNGEDKNANVAKKVKNEQLWLYFSPQSSFVLVWNLAFIVLFYWIELQISVAVAFGVTFF